MGSPTLAQRLGYPADAKLLIINADDLGSCHSANVGVFECLATGLVTSATLMVPCPWAREASSRYRGEDIGVHLTVNAEYELYRWGPITHAPSLLGGDGGFPRTVQDVWDHADLDEVRRECRAQIERAILWGFDVSHLDAHMGTLQLRPEFFDVYLDMAIEFALPLRMISAGMERYVGFPSRAVATEAGAVFTDHMRFVPGVGSRQMFEKDLATLKPGVTEMHLHPAVDSAELQSLASDDWESRVDDHRMVCEESWVRDTIEATGATLIGFRPLRDLARSGAEVVPETTVRGVSLYSEGRSKSSDVFELSLTYEGIEIRRPGEEARHLAWDRITEWEIEQRRGGVLLILRGSGSVTPLVIPKWRVDDLDLILRDVTNGPTEATTEMEIETDDVVEAEFAPEPEPEPEPEVEVEVMAEVEVEVVEVEVHDVEVAEIDEVVGVATPVAAEPEPATTFEDVVTKAFTPVRDPDFEVVLDAGPSTEAADEAEVDGTLVWPSGPALEGLPDLVWPEEVDVPIVPARAEKAADASETPVDEGTELVWPEEPVSAEVDSDFMAGRQHSPTPPPVRETSPKTPTSASAAAWTIEEIPDMAPAIPEAFPSAPPRVETTAAPPTPRRRAAAVSPSAAAVAPSTAAVPRTPRVEPTLRTVQRRRERRRITLRSVATLVLLGALAVAVALVLAQSAGLVHLGFLGSPG